MDADAPPVVVHPPAPNGTRRVTVRGESVGLAGGMADLVEFLRRTGLDEAEVEETQLIEWRGGGPETWD